MMWQQHSMLLSWEGYQARISVSHQSLFYFYVSVILKAYDVLFPYFEIARGRTRACDAFQIPEI